MIPVGTLCLLRGLEQCCVNGRVCEVVGHVFPAVCGCDHSVAIPGMPGVGIWPGDGWLTPESKLIPIAPPGDPDAVPHDVSEPELLEVFR